MPDISILEDSLDEYEAFLERYDSLLGKVEEIYRDEPDSERRNDILSALMPIPSPPSKPDFPKTYLSLVSLHSRLVQLCSPHRADRILNQICAWTPFKIREDLLGDLFEEVTRLRSEGWTERRLKRLIYWQVGWAFLWWVCSHLERAAKVVRGFQG